MTGAERRTPSPLQAKGRQALSPALTLTSPVEKYAAPNAGEVANTGDIGW